MCIKKIILLISVKYIIKNVSLFFFLNLFYIIMINFSLMGAGRIGKMHAKFIAAHPKAKLKYIYDPNSQLSLIHI